MTNVIRHLHRLAGGAGAGSPATVAPSGVVAVNFDTGAGTPELWASNGTAWQQLNPPGAVTATTAANIITGTATGEFIEPATLASAATNTSAGAADAGKYVRLDAGGKIAASLLDSTAISTALAPNTTTTSAGAADANKYVTLDANGKIDSSVLNIEAMEYKGGVDVTAAAPGTPSVGDVYVVTTGGTIDASFTGPAGNPAAVGDMLIWGGTSWDHIEAANPDLSGYLPLAGTAGVTGAAMASGAVITMTPAAAGNTVFDGNGGSIVQAVIDAGTF